MASALAHPLFRAPTIDQGLLAGVDGISETDLGQYHGTNTNPRLPSPLATGPMFLHDTSRTSSSSTRASGQMLFQQPNFHTRSASLSAGRVEEYNRQQQQQQQQRPIPALPGLDALQGLASLASTKEPHFSSFSTTATATATSTMAYNAISAVPTPGISGNNNMPPVCQNCETSTTPLWRRDESGSVLCNACGLFLKLHGRPRPISLKTDVIKSRNRVKTANQGPRKQVWAQAHGVANATNLIGVLQIHQSLPASQSTDIFHNGAHRRVSQMSAHFNPPRSQSPISRTGTPSMHHDPNIAPQHMFDGVSLHDHAFQTPALPNLGSHPSPSSLSSLNDRQLEPPMTYEQLFAQNTMLKTRVSELEVINMMYSDNENNLRRERDDAIRTQDELKRRIEELEAPARSTELEHPKKRVRTEETSTEAQPEAVGNVDQLESPSTPQVQ